MKCYGPLLAVSEALTVGDPGRHHLRLTPEAAIIREGVENRGILPGSNWTTSTWHVTPDSRWRAKHPTPDRPQTSHRDPPES